MKCWQWVGWAVVVLIVGSAGTSATAIAGEVPTSSQPSLYQEERVETGEGADSSLHPLQEGTEGGNAALQPATAIPQLSELEQPATTIEDWVAQIEASLVQITDVRVEETEAGLQVILETADGSLEVPETRSLGNALIADIPNATVAEEFSQANPSKGIALVSVTQLPGDRVRVAITGTDAPPVAEVTSEAQGLVLVVTLGDANTVAEEDAIEVVVTGEREGYRVPDASVGTRTDTPLRDIPQSIQVIPEQVLEDRQVRSITEGLENTAGVTSIVSPASGRDYFVIRGFESVGFLINGLPDPQISSDGSFINAERLEVLRGPAATLYGEVGSLGGTINVVTRQPLSYPFYEVSATAGSYDDYQGIIDLSGPLDNSGTLLYRLIGSYRDYDSFLDFDENSETFVAPSLAFRFDPDTDFILEGDVNFLDQNGREAQPISGTVIENPNGEVSRSFNAAGPLDNEQRINGRVGYRLEHRFNEDWRLRNAFRYTFYDDNTNDGEPIIFSDSLADDNRTLNRGFLIGSQYYDTFYLDTNLLGRFNTGPIEHQLLVGIDLNRDTTDLNYESGDAQPIDIFDPVFDQTVNPTGQLSTDSFTTRDTVGFYLQDQITILDNLKLLLGGRVDLFEETADDRLTNEETSQSDTAFSPRVGIVYQPVPPISLYASYARSFVPTIGIAEGGDIFRPERGTQYEVGIKADITDQLSANLALYDLTRSNVTTPSPDNPVFSVQTGEQRSQGIELDISGEILPGWNIIGGYAYTNARITEDNDPTIEGNQRFSAPEHSFNLWTTYRIQEGDLQGLGFGVGFFYIGERWVDNANTVELPSFFRTDAAIFYERDQFRAALNLSKIFDVENYTSDYGSSTFVNRGDPFTLLGTVSWQF